MIAILQPCFIPWMGYFEQMELADLFVYMDDVQYTKRDWRNTNKLLCPSGPKRVSIPVKKCPSGTLLNQVLISTSTDWRSDFLNKIKNWYRRAPYFREVYALIDDVLKHEYVYLVDLNYQLNAEICNYIGITTPTDQTSNVARKADDKQQRIIEIVKHYGEHILYDGKSAADFIDLQLFSDNGIKVIFQDYQYEPYRQHGQSEFHPYLSIVDLMMNHGQESLPFVLRSPKPAGMP